MQEPGEAFESKLIFSTASDGSALTSNLDFGVAAVGGYYDISIFVFNAGKNPARSVADTSSSAQKFNYVGGVYPGTGGTCANLLAVGESCILTLRFSPTDTTTSTGEISLSYDDKISGAKSSVLALSGRGGTPALLTVSDAPLYDYGTIAIGAFADYTFTISNSGEARAISISEIGLATHFAFKGGTYPGSGGNCPLEISGGASCTVVVSFTPVLLGVLTDTINFSYFDGANNQNATRDIQGTGVFPAVLEISDAPLYSFGTVLIGQMPTYTFTISNTGGMTATAMFIGGLAAPYSFLGGAYPGVGGTCGISLPVATNCTVVVQFSPVIPGTFSETINVVYNSGAVLASVDRDITGLAVAPALIDISDSALYNFGTVAVGSSTNHTFTLTNNGGVTATLVSGAGLAAPYNFLGGAFPGAGGTCTGNLLPGATCDVVVNYQPLVVGLTTDTLDINYNNGIVLTQSNRDIQGTAAAPAALSITDGPTYDFGTIAVGASNTHLFTISNSGGVAASLVNISSLSAPFAFVGGAYPGTGGTCTGTIIAGTSCTINLSFTPIATGLFTDTIDIDHNDGAAFQTVSRNVQGNGVLPANLSISDGPTYDYGQVVVGGSAEHIFTVTNIGGIDAITISGSGLAAPFAYKGGNYPGTGGTCVNTLAATASCSIIVTYQPTAGGIDNDTIELDYFDGASTQQAQRDVTGQGFPPAVLTISDGLIYNYGTIATGATINYMFTITNIGGTTATAMAGLGLASPFNYFGGAYPGTGGTCGLALATVSSCTIVVEFAPIVNGAYLDTIQIDYFDGVIAQSSLRDIQGSGADPALLEISDAPLYDFGQRAVGSSIAKIFTVINNGGVNASGMSGIGLAAPFTYTGGAYPGTAGTCGASLVPTITCTIDVTFTPLAVAVVSDTIQLDYYNGAANVSATGNVQGEGVAPATLTISEVDPYDYGTFSVGSTNSHIFTVTNTGGFPATATTELSLAAPFRFAGGSFPGTTGTCTATITNGSSCSIVVDFMPTATGLANGTIQFSYNDGANNQTVSRLIQGTGASPATLTISAGPTYDFGSQPTGINVNFTFTITNTGGFAASAMVGGGLAAPFDFDGGVYPGAGGTCGAVLASAATCTIVVSYQPMALGLLTDTITINYNDGSVAQTATRDIRGTGVSPALLTIAGANPYNYGTLATGSVTNHTLTVTNAGGFMATALAEVGLAAPFTFAGGIFPGTGGTCVVTLAVGATCDIVVAFSPLIVGLQTDTIDLNYNDGVNAQTVTLNLQGTGAIPAAIAISDGPTYDYGAVAMGSSNNYTLTLTNTGGVTATAMAGSGLAAPFTFAGGSYPGTAGTCGVTLAATATCTIVVNFSPTATGLQTDTISIDYYDGSANQSSLRDVQGTGATPAILAISDAPSYDFGTSAVGSTTTYTFTVSNTGGITATALSGGAFGVNFRFAGGIYPGTAGTCTATLAAAANCTVVVDFIPTSSGALADTLTVNYIDGANPQSSTRPIQGTGAAPALLTISNGPTYNYGNQAIGSTINVVLTVTNAGGVAATAMSGSGLAAPYDFAGAVYPGTAGTCAGALAPAATCTIVVAFSPLASGTFNDSVVVDYNNGSVVTSTSRALTGNGTLPASMTISDGPTYDYSTQAVGSTTNHSFTVTNTGGFSASLMNGVGLAAPFDYFGGSYPGTGGTCGATLAPLATCTMIVSFAPSAMLVSNDTIEINYFDGVAAQNSTRDVQGEGVTPAILSISDGPTYDFGGHSVGSATNYTFTVTNTGGAPAVSVTGSGLAAPFSFAGGSYPGTAGTCGATIANGASCSIVVTFAPTATGLQTDTISVDYSDGALAQSATRDVQGSGVTPAILVVSDGPTYNYGTAPNGSSNDYTFTINNTGGFTATAMTGSGLASPFTFKGGAYPGTAGTCVATLAAGATCTIVVNYSPLTTGLATDTILIGYNDGSNAQTATRDIQGTGTPPATLTISDGPSYDFGIQATGSNTDFAFTVTNTGGFIASLMSGSGLAAPFEFSGGSYPGAGGTCAANLAAGATCTIVVRFSPIVVGGASDTIQLDYNNGFAVASVTRDVIATGANPASLSISDGPTFDFGTFATGATTTHTFTVSNIGGVPATAISEVGMGAPFTYVGGAYPGTAGTCGVSLLQGASCTIIVLYSPIATGIQTDTIQVNYYNGAANVNTTRDVQGTGAAPALITISDTDPYDFGMIANGSSGDRTFILTNIGGVPATTLAGSGIAAPFTFKGGSFPGTGGTCGASLAAAATCDVVVTFAPITSGAHSDTMTITYNDGVIAQASSRDVTGMGAVPALISISDGPTYDFGLAANSGTAAKAFTITNSGTVSATGIAEKIGRAHV